MKKFLSKLFPYRLRMFVYSTFSVYTKNTCRSNYAKAGPHTDLFGPLNLDPRYVELDDYTRLQPGIRVIGLSGKLVVKKFSAIGADTLIVPSNHIPTVGLPQYVSTAHINDVQSQIVVEEDCWVGARCILLSRCHVSRGAIVAAGSTITKEVPPYAVVAGNPAKIVAVRFSIEQIMEHERQLYPVGERMTKADLEILFAQHYEGKRVIGQACPTDKADELLNHKQQLGIAIYE